MLRQIISVIVGVSVTIARGISLFKQEESPRERALYDNLWQTAVFGAAQGLTTRDYPISNTLLPASLTILHTFTRVSPRGLPEVAGIDFPLPRALFPEGDLEDIAPPARELAPIPAESYKARLIACGVQMEEVPEKFFDNVVTFDLMEKPIIAITSTQIEGVEKHMKHVYDKSTFEKLGGICPENRQPFIEVQDNVELMAEMETFIASKKEEVSLQRAIFR